MTSKRWEELIVYKLRGARFDEHAGIELLDLDGLVHFRAAIVEVAKAEWKHRFRRQRVPKNIEEQIDLRVRSFTDGCVEARVFIGRPIPQSGEESGQVALFNEEALAEGGASDEEAFLDSFHRAADVLASLGGRPRAEDLPGWFPRAALLSWSKMCARIGPGDHLSLQPAQIPPPRRGTAPAPIAEEPPEVIESSLDTEGVRVHEEVFIPYDLAARVALPPPTRPDISSDSSAALRDLHKALVSAVRPPPAAATVPGGEAAADVRLRTLSGEVRMVDLDHGVRLHIHRGDEEGVRLHTRAEHQPDVIRALDEHDTVRLRVRGLARHQDGRVTEMQVDRLAVLELPKSDGPSEARFEFLAETDPTHLVALLAPDKLSPAFLTYAAEIAGRELSAAEVVAPLFRLLMHPDAVVREGAVYGLSRHPSSEIDLALAWVARDDESPGVRRAASAAIKRRARGAAEPDDETEGSES